MKKFFLLFAVAGMLVACGGNEEKKSGEDAAKKTEQTANDPKGATETPAQNDENVPDGDEGESDYGYESDFEGADFEGADFEGVDFEGVDFDDKYDSDLEYELDDDYSDLYDEEYYK